MTVSLGKCIDALEQDWLKKAELHGAIDGLASLRCRKARVIPHRNSGNQTPTCRCTSARFRGDIRAYFGFSTLVPPTSKPHTETLPEEGDRKPVIIRMLVDLPAPFGPEKTQDFSFLNRE